MGRMRVVYTSLGISRGEVSPPHTHAAERPALNSMCHRVSAMGKWKDE